MAKGMEIRKARHERRMKEIEIDNELILMDLEEKEAKRKYKKKLSTSKVGLWYMMIACTIIQIYSMVAMWHFQDLSPLTSLIGATVGEVFAYWAYSLKASKENCSGGITYEMAIREPESPEEQEPLG